MPSMSTNTVQTNMELDSKNFQIPGLAAISVKRDTSTLFGHESSDIAIPLEQSCQLLVRNLSSTSPTSAERNLKDLTRTVQANDPSLIKVTVVASTTRGKNIVFAFLQLDNPSTCSVFGLSKYIPYIINSKVPSTPHIPLSS